MFCPDCGTLAFPDANGNIRCPNPRCLYSGPIEKDLADITSSTETDTRDYEVIEESQLQNGTLTEGEYLCPKCKTDVTFVELRQTRASDEPETRILKCKNCKHNWREY